MAACCCGREFKTIRGMKIHRTRKGCLKDTEQRSQSQTEREAEEEIMDPETHHRVDDLPAQNQRTALHVNRKEKIKWPRMSDMKVWEELDEDLTSTLESILKGPFEKKMQSFSEITYSFCLEKFGPEEKPTRRPKQANRRQVEKGKLRSQHRTLKKQWSEAPNEEKEGLLILMDDLRKKIQAISRAEYERKKRQEKRQKREKFLKDPYGFTKSLFEQSRSGSLNVPQDVLEGHLKNTYSDQDRERPLPEMAGLVQPPEPEHQFDMSDLKLSEVMEMVEKARAKSAPGANGLSYRLLKKCPGVLKVLWRLLRVAWRQLNVHVNWCVAEGIYIPKEAESEGLTQFRPISLLNIEGKVLFGALAKRMTKFALQNRYINTSVQKAGIPGFPGCLEHATMIWSAIQEAKKEKKDLHVIWLDLANAYGSVPHKLIEKAMVFFHVPESVQTVIMKYYSQFRMRFTTKRYTTE